MSTKLANLALHCYLLDQALASQRRVFERKRTFGWGVTLEDWTTPSVAIVIAITTGLIIGLIM